MLGYSPHRWEPVGPRQSTAHKQASSCKETPPMRPSTSKIPCYEFGAKEAKMSTTDERERDAERRRSAEKALNRATTIRRIKDIIWAAVLASVITIIVLTSLGWLTTQAVVRTAREEGLKELVALRASICLVNFQQRPDAATKLAEFKALSYGDKDPAIRKFVAEQGLATMLGEDTPVAGAVDKCADAISRLS